MTEHKATPEQRAAGRYDWALADTEARHGDPAFRCIMELCSRVEALEAAAKPAESNYPSEPDSALGEWVADALDETLGGSDAQARAVLLVIAAWLRQRDTYVRASVQIAGVLERAADQHSS